MMDNISLLDCGHEPSNHSPYTTGYGQDSAGKRYCYTCIADMDRQSMIETGKAMLYLTHRIAPASELYTGVGISKPGIKWRVSNWPGSLEFPASVRIGSHNIAGKRYDAWFTGPDGFVWHGVTYGDNTQICHCKKTKTRANH